MSSVLHWLWYCFDLSGCWKTRRGKFSVKRKYQNSGRHDFCESRELSYSFLLSISSDFWVRNQIVKYDCFTDLTNSPQQNNSFQPWCWFCAHFLVHSKFFSQISMISFPRTWKHLKTKTFCWEKGLKACTVQRCVSLSCNRS